MKRILLLLLLAAPFCSFGQGSVRRVDTITQLLAIDPTKVAVSGTKLVYEVAGYTTAGDWGPARSIRWDSTSAATVDNGCVFDVTDAAGRWIADDCDDNTINVRWFGANGGANDTAAIQAAVNVTEAAVTLGNPDLYFPPGEYVVTNSIILAANPANYNAIAIRGAGKWLSHIRTTNTNAPIFRCDDIIPSGKISDLSLNGTGYNPTATYANGVHFTHSVNRFTFERVMFRLFANNGVRFGYTAPDTELNTYGIVVRDCLFQECFGGGLASDQNVVNQMLVTGSEFNGSYLAGVKGQSATAALAGTNNIGFVLPGARNVTFDNCILQSLHRGGVVQATDGDLNGWVFRENYWEAMDEFYVLFEDTDLTKTNTVNGLAFINNHSPISGAIPWYTCEDGLVLRRVGLTGLEYAGNHWNWPGTRTVDLEKLENVSTTGPYADANYVRLGLTEVNSYWRMPTNATFKPAMFSVRDPAGVSIGTGFKTTTVPTTWALSVGGEPYTTVMGPDRDNVYDLGGSTNRFYKTWTREIDSGTNYLVVSANIASLFSSAIAMTYTVADYGYGTNRAAIYVKKVNGVAEVFGINGTNGFQQLTGPAKMDQYGMMISTDVSTVRNGSATLQVVNTNGTLALSLATAPFYSAVAPTLDKQLSDGDATKRWWKTYTTEINSGDTYMLVNTTGGTFHNDPAFFAYDAGDPVIGTNRAAIYAKHDGTKVQLYGINGSGEAYKLTQAAGVTNLNELSDVNTNSIAINSILKWDGSEWIMGTDQSTAGTNSSEIYVNLSTLVAGPSINDSPWIKWYTSGTNITADFALLVADTNLVLRPNLTGIPGSSVGYYGIANSTSVIFNLYDKAVTLSKLATNGTANTNNVIKFNGTEWAVGDDNSGSGGGGLGTNIFVNNVLIQPAKLTNFASATGGIVWLTNAGGDIIAYATNVATGAGSTNYTTADSVAVTNFQSGVNVKLAVTGQNAVIDLHTNIYANDLGVGTLTLTNPLPAFVITNATANRFAIWGADYKLTNDVPETGTGSGVRAESPALTGTPTINTTNLMAAVDAKVPLAGGTMTGDLNVPDEAYGAGWNGSAEVPTKNALYDKIETLGSSSYTFSTGLTNAAGTVTAALAPGTGVSFATNAQTITISSTATGGGLGTNIFVNNILKQPAKLTNNSAATGGIEWSTNAAGDVLATAVNLPSVTNAPVSGLWQRWGYAELIITNTQFIGDIQWSSVGGNVSAVTLTSTGANTEPATIELTFSSARNTNYLVVCEFESITTEFAIESWVEAGSRGSNSVKVTLTSDGMSVYATPGRMIRVNVIEPNATAGGSGGSGASLSATNYWTAPQHFGTATATTPSAGDNSTNVATTAFVQGETDTVSKRGRITRIYGNCIAQSAANAMLPFTGAAISSGTVGVDAPFSSKIGDRFGIVNLRTATGATTDTGYYFSTSLTEAYATNGLMFATKFVPSITNGTLARLGWGDSINTANDTDACLLALSNSVVVGLVLNNGSQAMTPTSFVIPQGVLSEGKAWISNSITHFELLTNNVVAWQESLTNAPPATTARTFGAIIKMWNTSTAATNAAVCMKIDDFLLEYPQ